MQAVVTQEAANAWFNSLTFGLDEHGWVVTVEGDGRPATPDEIRRVFEVFGNLPGFDLKLHPDLELKYGFWTF